MKYELNLIERYKENESKGFSAGVAEGEALRESRGIKISETQGEANATSCIVK